MLFTKADRCTYAEYAAWDTEDKYELFDGVPVMQARPSIAHQHIQAEIITALKVFLRDKPCRAFAEIEVLLPDSSRQGADDVRNVFIPDISVICVITALKVFLRDKPCRAFAEIEVLLPDSSRQGADDVRNVFIPDISVICEPEKLTKQYCKGAPTVIMEILSPATAKIDRFVKLNAYQKAGVPEYWIISPSENTVTVFELHGDIYTTRAVYNQKDNEAEVFSLHGCKIDLTTVFQDGGAW